ncbi:plasmid segregation protein ParM [Brevibacillus sp. HD3.3A]|uniref:ParM/StbA family protein n=1 Tax=Brevibacillus sp. HD3.3A TaxID=2738979 RepID=UPI00156A9FD4|nr:plasmid segregation protein ParM [Brevibacillus sp. HD3.3A]UED72096.1 plasmid segregation protein ParM [Brevibacillus sp. HD3.3A]
MIVIGLDHGNTNVKGVSEEGELLRPSAYALPDSFGEEGLGNGKQFKVKTYTSNKYEKEQYVWGEDVTEASMLIPTYTTDNRYAQKSYRLLSEFALASLVSDKKKTFDNVLVVTGCPSKEKGTRLETELEEIFSGGHVVTVNGATKIIEVSNVIVLPQPLGTVLSLYLDEEGYVEDESYEEDYVGVIDIGGGTTDLDGIKGLKRQKEDTETIPYAMYKVFEEICDYIIGQHPESGATVQSVEKQILTGSDSYVISKRSSIDIKAVKEDVLRKYADRIIPRISSRWNNRAKFDKLLLTGGGAEIMAPYFKAWENDIIVVKDSQIANAKGFFRYGKFKARG